MELIKTLYKVEFFEEDKQAWKLITENLRWEQAIHVQQNIVDMIHLVNGTEPTTRIVPQK